jgi:surfactin synthase thioesterase subunit
MRSMKVATYRSQTRLIDRQALGLSTAFSIPAEGLESEIADAFAQCFDVNRVGADDEFFELGGDSMSAVSLSLTVSRIAGLEFPVSQLVDHGTPRAIARFLARERETAPSIELRRPPIFAVHGRLGFMLPRPAFLGGLRPGQRLRMFELPGLRGTGPCLTRIEDIAEAYVARISTEYPDGPILLAAFCLGGVIAIEMAAQLAAKGRPVLQLVLLDPSLPGHYVRAHRRRLASQLDASRDTTATRSWVDLFTQPPGFADGALRWLRESYYKYRFLRARLVGRPRDLENKFPGQGFSIDAQAKLLAAYRHYQPRPFSGPVAVLCSEDRRVRFGDASSAWTRLLPRAEVHVVGDSHRTILDATTSYPASLMQATFDVALATQHPIDVKPTLAHGARSAA